MDLPFAVPSPAEAATAPSASARSFAGSSAGPIVYDNLRSGHFGPPGAAEAEAAGGAAPRPSLVGRGEDYLKGYLQHQRPGGGGGETASHDDDDDDDDDPGGLQGVDWTSVPDPVRRHMEARQLARAAHARREAWEAQNPRLARQMRETEQHLRDIGYTAEAAVPAQRQAKNKRKGGANPPKRKKRRRRRGS